MTTVRYINRAIVASLTNGIEVLYHGFYSKHPARIYDCKSRKGIVMVRFLSTGVWVELRAGDFVSVGDTVYKAA